MRATFIDAKTICLVSSYGHGVNNLYVKLNIDSGKRTESSASCEAEKKYPEANLGEEKNLQQQLNSLKLPKGYKIGYIYKFPESVKKTFISSRCGFKISYPDKWNIEDSNIYEGLGEPTRLLTCVDIHGPDYVLRDDGPHGLVVNISRYKIGMTLYDDKSTPINSLDDFIAWKEAFDTLENKKDKTYGSISGVQYDISGNGTFFVFTQNGYIFSAFWKYDGANTYDNEIGTILGSIMPLGN